MIKILTGIDIVDISDFKKSLKNGGKIFLDKIFTKSEQKNLNPIHLAGVFAAKEAITKALSMPIGSWLKIEISHEKSGRPKVSFPLSGKYQSFDLSISHTEETAIASFVALG